MATCVRCGVANDDVATVCATCGAELGGAGAATAVSAASSSVPPQAVASAPPLPNQRFCPGCGKPIVTTAVVCPSCGTATGSPRSKGIAVLLAVFFSFWSWLYTYQRSKVKFWWGLGLSIVGSFLVVVLVGIFFLFGVWLWAVIDTATKPESYFTGYPNDLTPVDMEAA